MAKAEHVLRRIPGVSEVAKMFGASSEEEDRVQEEWARMQQAVESYRPASLDAQFGGLQNRLGLFGPVNDLLGQMYGPGAQFDLSAAMGNNPFASLAQPPPAGPPPEQMDPRLAGRAGDSFDGSGGTGGYLGVRPLPGPGIDQAFAEAQRLQKKRRLGIERGKQYPVEMPARGRVVR